MLPHWLFRSSRTLFARAPRGESIQEVIPNHELNQVELLRRGVCLLSTTPTSQNRRSGVALVDACDPHSLHDASKSSWSYFWSVQPPLYARLAFQRLLTTSEWGQRIRGPFPSAVRRNVAFHRNLLTDLNRSIGIPQELLKPETQDSSLPVGLFL